MPSVLVTGGTGYLGQFLLSSLAADPDARVAFTYHSRIPTKDQLAALGNPGAFRVDLTTGQGLEHCLAFFGGSLPDVVINCAALSIPRDCETDPTTARALNVPQPLLSWLRNGTPPPHDAQGNSLPLLIHLSTDQVYSGQKAWSREEDEVAPVNTYGRTKVQAEVEIQRQWPNHAILRSSIIVGPAAPAIPLAKTPPLLWMDKALGSGQPSTFFQDEYRCPVFVQDLVEACRSIMRLSAKGAPLQLLLNAGGPDRLSRAGMAEVLAQVRRYAAATPQDVAAGAVEIEAPKGSLPPLSSIVTRVPAASAGNRGVNSPLDISMDVSKISSALGITLTPFARACELSFQKNPTVQ